MTDRELLELAAVAAGGISTNGLGGCFDLEREQVWNPLTDDGDALRLSVKLRLCVDNCIGEEGDRDDVTVGNEIGRAYSVFADEFHRDDPYAATRRAIVRAAAEIGKGMK